MGVSFIICAYNEEKYIFHCLHSIKQACVQHMETHKYFKHEIILVDNNSTDWTVQQATYVGVLFHGPIKGIQVISETKQGIAAAREAGRKKAQFEILVFLDADTIMPGPQWIEEMLRTMSKPNVVACSGPIHYYDGGKFVNFGEKIFYPIARLLSHKMPTLQGGNYAIKNYACVEGFDTNLEYWGEDTAAAIQARKHGKVILNPKMVMHASARKFKQDGLFKTIGLYILNHFYLNIRGKPFNKEYKNFR